jgi:hypothetical protein
MNNNKNKPGSKEGCQRIDWEVGITEIGDVYVKFTNGEQRFRCSMDKHTADEMGKAMVNAASKAVEPGEALIQ